MKNCRDRRRKYLTEPGGTDRISYRTTDESPAPSGGEERPMNRRVLSIYHAAARHYDAKTESAPAISWEEYERMMDTMNKADEIAAALESTSSPLALYRLLEEIVALGEQDEKIAAPLYRDICARLEEIEYEHL
jgi:hypothetical protein